MQLRPSWHVLIIIRMHVVASHAILADVYRVLIAFYKLHLGIKLPNFGVNKLIAPLFWAGSCRGQWYGGTCSCRRCACNAGDGDARDQQREDSMLFRKEESLSGPARPGEASESTHVARQSPLTGFTIGVLVVHHLSRLISSLTIHTGIMIISINILKVGFNFLLK